MSFKNWSKWNAIYIYPTASYYTSSQSTGIEIKLVWCITAYTMSCIETCQSQVNRRYLGLNNRGIHKLCQQFILVYSSPFKNRIGLSYWQKKGNCFLLGSTEEKNFIQMKKVVESCTGWRKIWMPPVRLHTNTSAVDDALWWPTHGRPGRVRPTYSRSQARWGSSIQPYLTAHHHKKTCKFWLISMLKKSDRLKIAMVSKNQ